MDVKGGAHYHLQNTSFAFPLRAVSVKKNLRCCFVASCTCRAENQVQEDKKNMRSTELWGGVFRRGAEHPLASSVRHWFRLSFGTPFWALHSSTRNHATWFSMFFLSYSIKRRTFCCFSFASVLGTCFALQAHLFNPRPPL